MNKRALFFPSPPSSGSIGSSIKCLGLAKELTSRGYECAFVIGGELGRFFKSKGFCVFDFPVPKHKKTLQDINNVFDFMDWTGLLDEEYIETSINKEIKAINNFRPDVAFTETRLSTGISLPSKNIPYIAVTSGPCTQYNMSSKHRIILNKINKIKKNYLLKPSQSITELLSNNATVQISPSIPELEPLLKTHNNIIFTGHALHLGYDDNYTEENKFDYWLEKQKERKILMVYLSVGALSPTLYKKVLLDTIDKLEMSIVCCLGNHYLVDNIDNDINNNIFFSKYIPMNKLKDKISFMIFHGGQDTMMFSLLNGTPSICFPGQHFERRYNAEQLQKLGVSKSCELYSFRNNSLIKHIKNLITTPKKTLDLWSELVQSYGGLNKCIEIFNNINSFTNKNNH